MQVSVVIPAYNRAHVLPRALDSVFKQETNPLEVILVDDGSTDGTSEWVGNRYPEVRLIRSEQNLGVSHARNRGIEASRGDWVAFLDSDDEWLPQKLSRQQESISNATAHLCHTDEIWVRNGVRVNPHKKHRKPDGWVFQQCLPLCAISPSSALIKKSLFDELGLFDESLPACEDYDLWLRITSRYPVVLVDEPLLVKYGGHQDQLSRKHWGMDRFRVKSLRKVIDRGDLNNDDHSAAQDVLLTKLRILEQGARKRGRQQQADEWKAVMNRYQPQNTCTRRASES